MTYEEAIACKAYLTDYTPFARVWVTELQGTGQWAIDVVHDDGTHRQYKARQGNPMADAVLPQNVEQSVRILDDMFLKQP